MTAVCWSRFPLFNKKRRTVPWGLGCLAIGRARSAAVRESPELRGRKCPRKLGTWLTSALAEHPTRCTNAESDSEGTAGDWL